MKSKWNPVQIVVRCKDCGELVATLKLESRKPVAKMTNQQRFWFLHLVLADALEQGKLSKDVFNQHNLQAEFIF